MATVPDDHPYLDAVRPPEVERIRFRAIGGPWAPSPLLDPETLVRNLAHLDVIHVHFGYEAATGADLVDWARAVNDSAVALVVTVHDLRNPHEPDRTWHDARLDALISAADAVLTLTDAAADEIRRRWNRTAVVVPHPSLWSAPRRPGPEWLELSASGPNGAPRVGLHLKSLRTNVVDPMRLVVACADATRGMGAILQVDLHSDVRNKPRLAPLLKGTAFTGVDVRVHDRFDDDALLSYLSRLDVSVLPYRFGTHSGWLELCRDVGTAVVAPDCGYFADQWAAVRSYINNEIDGLDEASLTAAVRAALIAGRPAPADAAQRTAQRRAGQQAHLDVYRRVRADSVSQLSMAHP